MSSIFPLRETVSNDEQDGPRLVDLDEETADEVFDALSAQTTRHIFLSLHDEPQTASDLAAETETSVQNIQYHIEKLQSAELIDAVDTWYSERGSEMSVAGPLCRRGQTAVATVTF
jgi:DNA-binding transcriptional ArsR family regulator